LTLIHHFSTEVVSNLYESESNPMSTWEVDSIRVQPEPMVAAHTTGGRLWPAAGRLVQFLFHPSTRQGLGLEEPGCQILELGAGLGYAGLAVARNCKEARVVLTEQVAGGGLAWLEHNVGLNTDHLAGNVQVRACDWRFMCAKPDFVGDARMREDRHMLENTHWNVIIGR
jgi:hypothetical protein